MWRNDFDFFGPDNKRLLNFFVIPTIENGEELCLRVFWFLFLTKSVTTNKHRKGL